MGAPLQQFNNYRASMMIKLVFFISMIVAVSFATPVRPWDEEFDSAVDAIRRVDTEIELQTNAGRRRFSVHKKHYQGHSIADWMTIERDESHRRLMMKQMKKQERALKGKCCWRYKAQLKKGRISCSKCPEGSHIVPKGMPTKAVPDVWHQHCMSEHRCS